MKFSKSESLMNAVASDLVVTPYSLYNENNQYFELELPYDGHKSDDILTRLLESVISYTECGSALCIEAYTYEFTNSLKLESDETHKPKFPNCKSGKPHKAIPLSKITGKFDEPIVVSKFNRNGDVIARVRYTKPTIKVNKEIGNHKKLLAKDDNVYEDGIPLKLYLVAEFKDKEVEFVE